MWGVKVEEHRERRAAERAEKQRLAAQLQVPAPCLAVLSSACALCFSGECMHAP